jgi:hypothetical protein
VFLVLPQSEADRVKSEINTAVAQDKVVRAVGDRTQQALNLVATEAQRLCEGQPRTCLETASGAIRGAISMK